MPFLACRVFDSPEVNHQLVQLELNDLSDGDTVIKVDYSSINYKDALAASGRGKIMKSFPLNAGIDLAGTIEQTSNPNFKAGQKILVNGCGIGENHDGGLAEYARVKSEWLIALPEAYDTRQAMIIGTAGFTAALAIYRMQQNGQTPDKGPIVVTGASGGVGSFAVNLLSKMGYETIALTSRQSMRDYLQGLGAGQITELDKLDLSDKPLAKAVYGGAIDNIGGETLSKIIAHTNLWGNVASIGLADSPKLNAMVFPFILRGVSLLGISSTNCPMDLRTKIWQQFGNELPLPDFEKIVSEEIKLADVSPYFDQLIDKKHHGRLIVNCQ
ncbi:YhdH/YhfP family quinone oxidoreductase [Kangiella sp. HZ709]|uniref:YhdH/YhfP family quinone oxidoreductase n=1 Tax=Kangiella sp. HZ709 TaxID=2666328 RepID=UPI0012AFCBE0|nr:YhdH/YhfP family quinone oxidoreductase [Kangiella sp. HZ709]MRX27380.1 acryloyl-CoA reductase [Kangiella sp. HZ709]